MHASRETHMFVMRQERNATGLCKKLHRVEQVHEKRCQARQIWTLKLSHLLGVLLFFGFPPFPPHVNMAVSTSELMPRSFAVVLSQIKGAICRRLLKPIEAAY